MPSSTTNSTRGYPNNHRVQRSENFDLNNRETSKTLTKGTKAMSSIPTNVPSEGDKTDTSHVPRTIGTSITRKNEDKNPFPQGDKRCEGGGMNNGSAPKVKPHVINTQSRPAAGSIVHPLPVRPTCPAPPKVAFYPFGWNAYTTRARKNEVCNNFLNGRCKFNEDCSRIHPIGPPNIQKMARPLERQRSSPYPVFTVKPPPKDTRVPNIANHYTNSQSEEERRSGKLSMKGQAGEASKNFPDDGGLNEQSSSDSSLGNGKSSNSLTGPPPSTSDPNFHDRYSDLCWYPGTGFWGYKVDAAAWTDNRQPSDRSSDSSIYDSAPSSPQAASSRSSVVDESQKDARQLLKHPPPMSPGVCRRWLRGVCNNGYSCYYVHDDLEYDPPLKGLRLPPSGGVCIWWLRDKCFRGYSCGYIHNDLEYDSLPETGLAPPQVPSPVNTTARVDHKIPQRPVTLPAPASHWSITVHDHVRVKFHSGFEVTEVITGFETPWAFLGNIPTRVTPDDISDLLLPFGKVLEVKLPSISNTGFITAKARFTTAEEARQASTALNGVQAFGVKITARLPVGDASRINFTFQDTAVRIQWPAPSKVGYGGYPTMEHANKAIAAARIPFRDHYVQAAVHVGLPVVGVVTVRFRGLPIDANVGDMERFAHPEDIVWERPNYTSLPPAINGIKRVLGDNTELLSFDILPPPYRHGATIIAWAHFVTPSDAQAACNRLNGRKPMYTGKSRITARHVHTLSYSVSQVVYDNVEKDIIDLRQTTWDRSRITISVVSRPPPSPVLVKISGEDIKELGQLKAEFEKILNGEVLREGGKVAWDDFFARLVGVSFLQAIERENPGVTIQRDVPKRMIRLLGSSRNREVVRQKIVRKLVALRSQHLRSISLAGHPIGLFMGQDLVELKSAIGPENVILDFWNQSLKIRGDDIAFATAKEAVERICRRHTVGRRSNIVECPVCFDEVTNPVSLPCGHSWCRPCLSSYLLSSIDNRYFPLGCLGNGARCTERIALSTAQDLLPMRDFDAIVNTAFSSYVQSRPEEFHYCPSPDCPQIYRTAPRDTVLQCPSCLLRICPNCHVEAHDGFVCPDRDGDDNRFKEWMKNHDVKKCPGCRVPIERSEGCNHMTCTRCQTHICWECLQTFPRGNGIYDHMRQMHGGIGLGPLD